LNPPANNRGQWSSQLGFVLAAAGSAIGLGNIWRFPIEAANNGGFAFLLVYLASVFLIGMPVMLAELTIGRHSGKNPVGAFRTALPGTRWWLLGALGVTTGMVILSYYSVVAGWTLGYVAKTASHSFAAGISPEEVGAQFAVFAGSWWIQLLLHGVFMALCVGVVVGGVQSGIERWAKILMPLLLLLLLLLVVRSITLPGAGAGLAFYLKPDFSKLDFKVLVAALGQAFFSMSLGMGAMITYGSYLSKRENLVKCTAWVGSADAAIAFLAGLLVLPALAMSGIRPGLDEGGAGLIFAVLPKVFSEMPWQPFGGIAFGTLFFVLLAVAGLTSAVSLVEVVTAYFVDERGWPRRRAVTLVGSAAFVLGVPSALGFGAVGWLSAVATIGGTPMAFLDLAHTIFGKLSLTFGALMTCVVVAWVWGVGSARSEIADGEPGLEAVGRFWLFLLRWVCPLAITVILASLIVDPSAIR
jgi:NSS family neurotransmitter:Na+ symporter